MVRRRSENAPRRPRLRSALVVCAALAVLGAVRPVRAREADPRPPAFGFSKLIVRLDKGDVFGVAGRDFLVYIIEELRRLHVNAVGAENLVFGKDLSDSAEYLLGGTLFDLDCANVDGAH